MEGKRTLLVMVKTNPHDHVMWKLRFRELRELAKSAGYRVVGEVVQTRLKETVNYVVGRGKLEEIKNLVEDASVDTVIFYNVLSSKQKYNLERELKRRVIDRYELTLEIFEKAATDKLAKLQIELARIKKVFPYFKLQARLKYLREHPGFKSAGEYAYHNKITFLRRRMRRIIEEIERERAIRLKQLERRRELGIPVVCVVGYYNSGKTTLFNALTGLNKPVSNKPFTTLSSKYYVYGNPHASFFLVDTIGFVLDLDPRLISSFRINLDDMKEADLLLLVADISESDELVTLKISTSLEILRELVGVPEEKIMVVLNKCDLLPGEELKRKLERLTPLIEPFGYVVVSAKKRKNLNSLVEAIVERLRVSSGLKWKVFVS